MMLSIRIPVSSGARPVTVEAARAASTPACHMPHVTCPHEHMLEGKHTMHSRVHQPSRMLSEPSRAAGDSRRACRQEGGVPAMPWMAKKPERVM